MSKIKIQFLPGINTLIIKKKAKDRFFSSNDTTLAINLRALSYLISVLVKKNILSPKVLEGILEEYYTE